jgi:hypothetical protein
MWLTMKAKKTSKFRNHQLKKRKGYRSKQNVLETTSVSDTHRVLESSRNIFFFEDQNLNVANETQNLFKINQVFFKDF